MNKNETLIYVIYDGIHNSVFPSQIITPILKKLELYKEIVIISFEPIELSNLKVYKIVPMDPKIKYVELKRQPFFGKITMLSSTIKLGFILRKYKNYHLIARGPFASWISRFAVGKECKSITLQARAIATEECAYTYNKKDNIVRKALNILKKQIYKEIESKAFRPHKKIKTFIEAVCPAIKEYLIKNFQVPEKFITIAEDDLPEKICPTKTEQWRNKTRQKLRIQSRHSLYCYSGSAKPWQCPQKTVDFFESCYDENFHAKFLILTQNIDFFKTILSNSSLPSHSYQILSVPHKEVCKYLASSDFGVIFLLQFSKITA